MTVRLRPRLSPSGGSRSQRPLLLEWAIEIVPPKHDVVRLVALVRQPEHDFGLDAAAMLQIDPDRRTQSLECVSRNALTCRTKQFLQALAVVGIGCPRLQDFMQDIRRHAGQRRQSLRRRIDELDLRLAAKDGYM